MARGPPALPDSYNPRGIITTIIAMVLIITNITIITVSTITITIIIVMFWTQRSSPVSVAPVLNHGPRKGKGDSINSSASITKSPNSQGPNTV